ncbi:MAG: FeoB small GTPase domain-containing protein, partial [Alphaproteobacteria bacterium]
MTKKIAIAGNPNCGKTCLFNNLTGARQKTGNWPGVTVEQKSGTFSHNNFDFEVIDLPGTYSISAYSIEEEVVETFLRETSPDILINIVDATNLKRHLYFTAQLIETGVPMILVLNMMDEAESKGINIDAEKLSTMLGVPVVKTIARANFGTKKLLSEIVQLIENPSLPKVKIDYGVE